MAKIKSIVGPIIPRNAADPAGEFGNLRNANKQLLKRYRNIQKGIRDLIASIDKRVLPEGQAGGIVTNDYEYLVDAAEFRRINIFIQQLLNDELLSNRQGQYSDLWWLNSMLDQAYENGTIDTLISSKNMATIEAVGVDLSQAMKSIQPEQIIFSRGYQSRVALVKSRVFEEMRGLTDTSRSDLSSTLARGMALGKGVRELTGDVMNRVGISHRRAKRIVRTEILNAHRTAAASELDELNADVYDGSDWVMKSLWFSAMSPTTRSWHLKRHGLTYTTKEVRNFYGVNGNAINCLCSQSPILVNIKTGEVLQEDLLKRMGKQRESAQKARGLIPNIFKHNIN